MTHHEHPNVAVVREGFEAMQRGDTAWIGQHLADDVVWHVGGNSKWAGAYEGKAKVLELFARQAQATERGRGRDPGRAEADPGPRTLPVGLLPRPSERPSKPAPGRQGQSWWPAVRSRSSATRSRSSAAT